MTATLEDRIWTEQEYRAAMSSAAINDLPDSAFAYIEPGGTKDASGKTTPRSKRHFPVHDVAHARNALARLSTSPFGARARAKVIAACHKFGIDVSSESKAAQRDPGFELRKRRRASMIRHAERRGMLLEVRAKPDGTGGTDFVFEGYGSVFDKPFPMWDRWGDPYTEVVKPGAFTRSLARPDLDVPFLIGHDDTRLALARTKNGTMQLSQDSRGLHVRAQLDGRRSDVRDLAYAVERGDMDEMSIGFVTMGQEWSADYETRSMLDLEMHRGDVSPVALAAIPETAGSTVAFPAEALSRQAREQRMPTAPYTVHANEDNECGQCQSMNDRDASFCDQCGARMSPTGPSAVTGEDETHQCGSCLSMNATDAKYCDQCGTELAGVRPYKKPGGGYASDRLAQGEVQDTSTRPDFNVPDVDGVGAHPCPHGVANSCSQLVPGDAKFCPNCGGAQYQGDGTLVVDDSGVVTEEGNKGDASLLALRRRQLELLALAR